MKYKDAVLLIRKDNLSGNDLFRRVADMFGIEGDERIQLRMGKNSKPSANLVRGVVEEMKLWITKVASGVGLPEESLKTLLNTEPGVIYSDWHVQDPQVTKIQKRVQRGLMRGEAPIQNLRIGDIEALTAMSLGNMISEARNITGKTHSSINALEQAIARLADTGEYKQFVLADKKLTEEPSKTNGSVATKAYKLVYDLFYDRLNTDAESLGERYLRGEIRFLSEKDVEDYVRQRRDKALACAHKYIPVFAKMFEFIQEKLAKIERT